MASWLQSQFRKAEELLEAVDRTAKKATVQNEGGGGVEVHPSRADRAIEEQLAALQPTSIRLPPKAIAAPESSPSQAVPEHSAPSQGLLKASEARLQLTEPKAEHPPQQQVPEDAPLQLPAARGNIVDSAGGATPSVHSLAEVEGGAGCSDGKPASNANSEADSSDAKDSSTLHVAEPNGTSTPAATADDEKAPLQLEKEVSSRQNGLPSGQGSAELSEVKSVNGGLPGVSATKSATPFNQPADVLAEEAGESATSHENKRKARSLMGQVATAGQTKEARLSRICEKLSVRVQEYKKENEQLEEMLQQSRDEQQASSGRIKALEQDLATAQAAVEMQEASLQTALAAKNAELEVMVVALEAAKREAAMVEGKLAALQASTDALTRGRDLTEGRMLQALREELAAAERRLEEESYAHAATRKAAAARETELESQMTGGVAALARMQRQLDERNEKIANLEHKLSMMEVECATLNQELQEVENKTRREQSRVNMQTEDAHSSQISVWKQEAERARAAQRDAEGRLNAQQADMQKMRAELAALRREADSTSVQAQAELEKRFRELTELLYLKQTQLEAMSSEKQAAVLQLEKEARRFQEAKAQFEREQRLRSRAVAAADEDGSVMAALDEKIHGSINKISTIRTAAKYLDFGTISAGRFLWRRPLARLGFLLYLVCLHLFIMHLLHRLQEQAERSGANAAAEYAAAAGLVKPGMVVDGRLP